MKSEKISKSLKQLNNIELKIELNNVDKMIENIMIIYEKTKALAYTGLELEILLREVINNTNIKLNELSKILTNNTIKNIKFLKNNLIE